MSTIELSQVPDFTGKVLSISTMDDDNSHDIADPEFEIQAGRLFIVGSTPDGASESNWCDGAKLAIAWERVTDYYVFDSPELYAEAIKISRQPDAQVPE